jgi:hypothetical protein
MAERRAHDPQLPRDDHGPFVAMDRLRIAMLDEAPPQAAEALFAPDGPAGRRVLARLRFFYWVLHELYAGNVPAWEASLERRDQRLHARSARPSN